MRPKFPPLVAALGWAVLAAIALFAAWDGWQRGVLDLTMRQGRVHIDPATDPTGYWVAEAALVLLGLFFVVLALRSVQRARRSGG